MNSKKKAIRGNYMKESKVNLRVMASPDKDIYSFVLRHENGDPLSWIDIMDALCEYMMIVEENAKAEAWSNGPV